MKLKNTETKRLILVDLDGTALMSDGKTIAPKTKEVLMKAVKDGHTVCLVTGRPYIASADAYKELGLTTLLTNFDGAHIHDPYKKEFKRILFPVSNDIVKQVLDNKVIKAKATNTMVEYYDRAMLQKKDDDLEDFFHLNDMDPEDFGYGDPATDWTGTATNIVIKVSDENKDDVIRSLSTFSNTVKIQSDTLYGFLRNDDQLPIISLTNKLANKGLAAKILAQYYNKDIRDVIAFGDQMNDAQMLQEVGFGIAMKNGSQTLKTIADGITYQTNDEGGVGYYLESLLKGEEL